MAVPPRSIFAGISGKWRAIAVPGEKLVGTSVSDRGEDGKITSTRTADGNYTWNFLGGGNNNRGVGTYDLDEEGLFVLTSEDTQIVYDIALKEDKYMTFELD